MDNPNLHAWLKDLAPDQRERQTVVVNADQLHRTLEGFFELMRQTDAYLFVLDSGAEPCLQATAKRGLRDSLQQAREAWKDA